MKEKEEKSKLKAKEIKNTTLEAKQVAIQLQLMAGQLDCLGHRILSEVQNEKYRHPKKK